MNLGDTIRLTRRNAFLTQGSFAKELNVAVSTVNKWESNKVKPNIKSIEAIKAFCIKSGLPYDNIESEWKSFKGDKDV